MHLVEYNGVHLSIENINFLPVLLQTNSLALQMNMPECVNDAIFAAAKQPISQIPQYETCPNSPVPGHVHTDGNGTDGPLDNG